MPAVENATGEVIYLWYKDDVQIDGAIASTYIIPSATYEDCLAIYTCELGDGSDWLTFTAHVNIDTNLTFTTPAQNQAVAVGGTLALDATATSDYTAGTIAYQWSLDGTALAGETNATYGVATVAAADWGTYTCAVSDGINTKTYMVVVSEPVPVAVTGVSLNLSSVQLGVGETQALIATVLPAGANNQGVSWSTSNSNVATVANGVITAVALGEATITVTTDDGDFTATCAVRVLVPVTNIELAFDTINAYLGDEHLIDYEITPNDATIQEVTWSSSNTAVATTVGGKIQAVGVGTATITVTTQNGKSDSLTFNVNNDPQDITLNAYELGLWTGERATLSAAVSPSNARQVGFYWTSSNSSIASVDGNGRVTGHRQGYAVITARSSAMPGKEAKCDVYVYLPPPEVTARAINQRSIAVSWESIPNIDGYLVLRIEQAYADSHTALEVVKKCEPIAIAYPGTTSLVDDTVSEGVSYYYFVAPYQGDEFCGFIVYSNAVMSGIAIPTVSTTISNYVNHTVHWDRNPDANGYEVYMSTNPNTGFKKIGTVTRNTTVGYTKKNLKVGVTYYFKVRGYKTVNRKKVYGQFSSVVESRAVLPNIEAPSINARIDNYTNGMVGWNQVGNATGYEVVMSTNPAGGFKKIGTITRGTTTGYKKTGLKVGVTYYFQVRAYATVAKTKVYGPYSQVVSAVANLPVLEAPSVNARIDNYTNGMVGWNQVGNATGYEVMMSTNPNGGFKKIGTITKGATTGYKKTGLKVGVTYYFQVRAYATVARTKIYSPYSQVVSAVANLPVLEVPTLNAGAEGTNGLLGWNQTGLATGYEIVMSTNPSGGFRKIATIARGTTLGYKKTGLKAGVTYYFQIRAYTTIARTKVYSGYSQVVSVTP